MLLIWEEQKSMQIVKYNKWYLLFSLIILIPGTISLIVNGLNLAIDFTGGSVTEYKFFEDNSNSQEKIEQIYIGNGVDIERIVAEGDSVVVRSKIIDVEKNDTIKTAVENEFGNVNQSSFETVGPAVGRETTNKAFLALGIVSVAIVLYISFAFRNIPKPYSSLKFGVSAIIAMLHDVLLVAGVFSILGKFRGVEIDALFITAVLTVIGFSVHDTIVVFDRIRENLSKLPRKMLFSDVVNYSIVETLNRSFAISLTVVMTLFALFLLGGQNIKNFVLALLIGIVSGTYSSIFNASPILVYWEQGFGKKS